MREDTSRSELDLSLFPFVLSFSSTSTSVGGTRRGLEGERNLQTADGNGAGVHNEGSLTVSDSTFSDCSAVLNGGAIYTTGTADISGSEFTGNSAENGGAIWASGELMLMENVFSDNTASTDESTANLFAAEDLVLDGCDNEGLENDTPCTPPEDSSTSKMGWCSVAGGFAGVLAYALV